MTLPNSKDIQFNIIYDKENEQILTFGTLEPETVCFLLMMKSLKWLITCLDICQLIFKSTDTSSFLIISAL